MLHFDLRTVGAVLVLPASDCGITTKNNSFWGWAVGDHAWHWARALRGVAN